MTTRGFITDFDDGHKIGLLCLLDLFCSTNKVSCSKWGQKGGAGPDEENLPAVLIFSACWPKKNGKAIFGTTVG